MHPQTSKHVKTLSRQLPHAVLLSGRPGLGLLTIATTIASGQPQASVHIITPEKSKAGVLAINVAQIRDLYMLTRNKHEFSQIVIIDAADSMSRAGQNAFLKLLEEPGAAIHFILLAHAPSQLLPTIISRVQQFVIRPISRSKSEALLDTLQVTSAIKRQQLLFLAEGLPAQLTHLATNDDAFHASAEKAKDARVLLQASTYDKLVLVQKYSSSRDSARGLLETALAILQTSLQQKPSSHHVHQLERLQTAYDGLASNRNVKLLLTQFVL